MNSSLMLIAIGIIIGVTLRKHAGLITLGVLALLLLINLDKILNLLAAIGKMASWGSSWGLW